MFSDKDRQIFRFNDGVSDVFGDPLVLHRHISQLLDWRAAEVIENSHSDVPPVRDAAIAKLAAVSREAFGLAPVVRGTGTGCTDRMALAVLNKFIDEIAEQKKSGVTSPSSPPPSRPLRPGFYPETPETEAPPRSTTPPSAA